MSQLSPDARAVARAIDALSAQVRRLADTRQTDFALTPDAADVVATTCSAAYRGRNYPPGECIRAAGHLTVTDHTDDLGHSWPDAVAVHPTFDEPLREAPAADEDAQRTARRASMRNLLSRASAGLTPDEDARLRQHVEAETRDADTSRAVAAGNKSHVRTLVTEIDRLTDDLKREQAASAGLAKNIKQQREALDKVGQQRDQAQAAIERVRAESARIRATTRTWEPVADIIDKALDGEQPTAAYTVSPGTAVVHGHPIADGADDLTTAPERQPAYDAVYAYIRQLGDELPSSKIQRNVIIWQAVAAALDANPTAEGTCDASTYSPLAGGSLIGPCTLRRNHDGPVHKDATGTTWLQQPLITAQARVQQLENNGEENARRHQSTIARVDELLADVSRTEAERDGAYRERAHLVALLAAMTDGAVIAPAPDVDEPGWQIAYLTIGGRQATWHISPRDADLVAHIEPVEPNDPRAQWDGHTTAQKYAHIAAVTAELAQQCGPACAEGHTYTGRCEGAGEACAQHPNAPVIGGMCGGCTQYPDDMTKEH